MKWLLCSVLGLQLLVAPLCAAGMICDDQPGQAGGHAATHQHSSGVTDTVHGDAAHRAPCESCGDVPGQHRAAAPDMASVSDCSDLVDGLLILPEKAGTWAASVSEGMPLAFASLDPPNSFWHPVTVPLPHGQVYQRTLRIRL